MRTMDLPTLDAARRAAGRAAELLLVLDREHTSEELHAAARAVRYELGTVQEGLSAPKSEPATEETIGHPEGAPARQEDLDRARRTRPRSGRHLVLLALGVAAATDHELVHALRDRMMPSSVHARRWELRAAGWLQPSVDEAPIPAVRKRDGQTVWELTDAGRAALAKLDAGQMVLALVGDGMPEVVDDARRAGWRGGEPVT